MGLDRDPVVAYADGRIETYGSRGKVTSIGRPPAVTQAEEFAEVYIRWCDSFTAALNAHVIQLAAEGYCCGAGMLACWVPPVATHLEAWRPPPIQFSPAAISSKSLRSMREVYPKCPHIDEDIAMADGVTENAEIRELRRLAEKYPDALRGSDGSAS